MTILRVTLMTGSLASGATGSTEVNRTGGESTSSACRRFFLRDGALRRLFRGSGGALRHIRSPTRIYIPVGPHLSEGPGVVRATTPGKPRNGHSNPKMGRIRGATDTGPLNLPLLHLE